MRIARTRSECRLEDFRSRQRYAFLDEKLGYVDSVNPNLGKFKSSGGKLLITHGWADTTITPETTVWYYEPVLNKMGNETKRLDATVHGPGNGSLRGRTWREYLRLYRHD
jgi:hypothetical protein